MPNHTRKHHNRATNNNIFVDPHANLNMNVANKLAKRYRLHNNNNNNNNNNINATGTLNVNTARKLAERYRKSPTRFLKRQGARRNIFKNNNYKHNGGTRRRRRRS